MPRIRALERQPLRVDQAEPIQRTEYHTRPGLCATTLEWPELIEQSPIDTLRLETREHSTQEPGKSYNQDYRLWVSLR